LGLIKFESKVGLVEIVVVARVLSLSFLIVWGGKKCLKGMGLWEMINHFCK
jgi:hypothetical protein